MQSPFFVFCYTRLCELTGSHKVFIIFKDTEGTQQLNLVLNSLKTAE